MMANNSKVKLGISGCLLGKNVRFDGGHKRNRFVVEELGSFAKFHPVCPEVEVGLPIPRPTLRLVQGADDKVHLVRAADGEDFSERMRDYGLKKAAVLREADLDGFILKRDSPSCGLERVKVYRGNRAYRDGRGLFAEALIKAFPHLPVEEEGRLNDPVLRDAFLTRVWAYRRLKQLRDDSKVHELVAMQSKEKFLLMAYHPFGQKVLGRIVATAASGAFSTARKNYVTEFMGALASPVGRNRHKNVLQHMAGYIRDCAPKGDRDELADCIEDYANGVVSRAVPMMLLRRHIRHHRVGYLANQTYLAPYPRVLEPSAPL